jgi:predicted  nucleic acid-binding Zn-ribbon protein
LLKYILVVPLKKDSFQARRRRGLKQAIDEAGDVELRELREAVTSRQERVAQLELELFDTRADLASFEREMEDRLGLLKRQIERLERRIEESRRRAARRAQWGDRADSPDTPEDVVEQFRKTWKRSGRPSKPFIKKKVNEATKEELKTVYRRLAKRFHPDLVRDPGEKQWREEQMAKVNNAYAENDMVALLAIEEGAEWTPVTPVRSREEEIVELRSEIKRLDGIIAELERSLRELINSDTVKLMLDATIARKSGRDLLREMENALLARVTELQSELASIS